VELWLLSQHNRLGRQPLAAVLVTPMTSTNSPLTSPATNYSILFLPTDSQRRGKRCPRLRPRGWDSKSASTLSISDAGRWGLQPGATPIPGSWTLWDGVRDLVRRDGGLADGLQSL